ncbi:MAG: hypothetical protein MJK04_04725, partial [Psychrosphaera sp.]|nr:hypothetical protein [Psychrosphaera sp.]
MKALIQTILILLFCVACSSSKQTQKGEPLTSTVIHYEVSIKDAAGNGKFKVTLTPSPLTEDNAIYHFASTVPGVYDTLDFGQLVLSFNAFDRHGHPLTSNKIATNQWKIDDIDKLHHIEYEISESFANPQGVSVAFMAGSDIDEDHVFFNTFAVLGYFEGTQSQAVSLKINRPTDWLLGSAMMSDERGLLQADSFQHLADSPIMMGNLDKASINVGGIAVETYVFSSNQKISAAQVQRIIEPSLRAAPEFLTYAPVKRYVILMEFLDSKTRKANGLRGIGALEHRTSSGYILPENDKILGILNEWVAHEFFHIAVPLNLHSDLIDPFDFQKANPDQHLWLYEGVTVWASEIMSLRAKQLSLTDYLSNIAYKIKQSKKVTTKDSFVDFSLAIYNHQENSNVGYIDNNASMAIMCLDIMMLEDSHTSSNSTEGFRELLIKLMKAYGPNRPFANDALFDIIEQYSSAKVGGFFKRYIEGNEVLNYNDYLSKIGLR